MELANAQSYSYNGNMKQIYSINYQMNVPTGASKDFISKGSFEGVNFNWAYFVTDNVAVGMDLSYNNYHQKIGKQIYRPNENMAINAAQYRYTQAFPLKAQVKYFFSQNRFLKGYAGLGIGALSAGQHIVVQDLDSWDNNWGFLVAPEIGVLIPFGADSPFGANLTAGYNFSTNNASLGNVSSDNRQSFYFNVGMYVAIF
jgi:outer membrane protein